MKLTRYFSIVIITVLLISMSATWLVNKGLQRSGVDFYGKINAAGDVNNRTSLLLIGSSRVLKHLDPQIIDSVTGLNAFNYGLNAGTIKTWYQILRYAVSYQQGIKAVVLNVDYNMFDVDRDPYKDAYYYPFENKLPGLTTGTTGTAGIVHKAKIFDISLYDDYAKYAAIDGWLRPNRIAAGVYKGYYPNTQLNYYETVTDTAINKTSITVSEKGFNWLNSCISICKQHNVKLVLVMAPYYKKYAPQNYYTNFDTVINRVQNIAQHNNIPFYNYTNMDIANDQQYFYNVNHLNSKGAYLYSLSVADSIKNYLSR